MQEKLKVMQDLTRGILSELGAVEVHPSPYAKMELMDRANIEADSWERDCVEEKRPEAADPLLLRTILMPSVLEVLGTEVAAGKQAKVYEINKTYTKNYVVPGAAPFTCWNIALGLCGEQEELSVLQDMVVALMEQTGIQNLEFVAEEEYATYDAERCVRIITRDYSGQEVELGIMGEFHQDVKANFGLGEHSCGAELFFDLIAEFGDRARQYHQSITQPSATIDAEILASEAEQLDELERQIKALFGTANFES